MLFIHQAPKGYAEAGRQGAMTPTRPSSQGDNRSGSRGRRTGSAGGSNGPRRPSSAVGNHATATSGAETPQRRAHGSGERASSNSRPGSANLVGRFGLRRHSPPTSARSSGPQGASASGGAPASSGTSGGENRNVNGAMMPNARPVTPIGRSYQLGQVRSSSQPGPVRVPSVGPTALPLHIAPGPGPTAQQRPRSPGTSGQKRSMTNGSPGGAYRDTKGSESSSRDTTAPPSRPDSANGQHSSVSSNNGSSSNSTKTDKGDGNLTTVISSALDYKRFLDRRKQMIQQQVESAQQNSHGSGSDYDLQAMPPVPAKSSGGRDTPDAKATEISPANDRPGPATNGWAPGATGPVKASHTVGAAMTANNARAGEAPRPQSSAAAYRDDELPESGSVSSRDRSSSAGATQHLLKHLQDKNRASTPTRYSQGASGAVPSEDSSSRPQSRSSTPAGGARQACRSLGASGEQRWVDRDQGSSGALGNTGIIDAPTADLSESADNSGRHKDKNREPSVDGLIRECGSSEARVNTGPLAGSSIEDYIIGKQIGQGAYATVFFGLHRESGKKVAIKIYEKYKLLDPQRRKSVRCEIRLMERLRHPNIVIFHDALDTPKQIYIIMDFVGGGSLHHFLKKRPGRRLDDQLAKRLIYQVAQGIKYLHDRHIVHRDIKLENLLLDDNGVVKIIDFGFSTIVPPGKRLKIFCGTPSYMAPEIVARKEYSGFCADIWAMGVLLYALLCGSFPFRGQNDRDLYRKIVRGVFHVPESVTDGARNLLNQALIPDMARRPSVDGVLADPWFSSHRDDLYTSMGKGSATCYQPNTSTSSTATTAAPSSSASASAGQSARENTSAEPPSAPSAGARAHSAPRSASAPVSAGPPSTSSGGAWSGSTTPGSATVNPAAIIGTMGQTQASTGSAGLPTEGRNSDHDDSLAAGTPCGAGGAQGQESTPHSRPSEDIPDRGFGRQFEEEAISKLERLGYPRDEIVRQLKDESSHLCKLYYRFLKALTAWDSKK